MNRLKLLIVLLLAMSFISAANAEKTLGPEPKVMGDLSLLIVASDSPDYVKEWVSTPPSHSVTIKRLKVAQPEQLIVTSFLVTGFTPDINGNISLLVSFALLDPNGKEIFSERHYAKASGKAPDNPSYIMIDPALDIVLEKTDPEGEYTIIGIVEDLVSKKHKKDRYKIKFVKKSI